MVPSLKPKLYLWLRRGAPPENLRPPPHLTEIVRRRKFSSLRGLEPMASNSTIGESTNCTRNANNKFSLQWVNRKCETELRSPSELRRSSAIWRICPRLSRNKVFRKGTFASIFFLFVYASWFKEIPEQFFDYTKIAERILCILYEMMQIFFLSASENESRI